MKKSSILPTHFAILTLIGIWRPTNWSSQPRRILYNAYTVLTISLMYTLAISQLAQIAFVSQSFSDFNDTFFILLSTNFACFKATCNLLNKRRMLQLVSMFEEDCCATQDEHEERIRRAYDETCRKIAISLLALTEVTGLFVVLAALHGNGIEERRLPYKVLLPYDLAHPLSYWLTFAHHNLGAVLFTSSSIVNDAMITGFLLQVCAQLRILEHRLGELSTKLVDKSRDVERRLLRRNVQHHVHIFRLAETICRTFQLVIVCQFVVSGLEICVSVYQLSVRSSNALELLTYSLYLSCMLGQFFVYCYFGNEVTLQSERVIGAIFNGDLAAMSLELQRDLSFVALRCSKPISISCGNFVNLTLDSFVRIVKTSYSTFTLLKRSV